LTSDHEIVITAVTRYGYMLEYAAPALKSDRDIVLTAIRSDARDAYKSAAPELRADREIILAAVTKDKYALEDVPPELQSDSEIVRAADYYEPVGRMQLEFGRDRRYSSWEVLC